MINIQIIRMKKIVDALIEYIRADYEAKFPALETETFLYRSLYGMTTGGADYDFYTQAKEIFLRDSNSPRKIQTGLMFPRQVQSTPHVHVREPAKQNGNFNSIGAGFSVNPVAGIGGNVIDEYRDTKRASYEIVITSDNPMDTILISEVMYSLMLGAYDTLSQLFTTFNFSMRELIMNQDIHTPFLYVKSITIDAQYENTATSIADKGYLNSLIFNMLA
jgi:hypothetical protein